VPNQLSSRVADRPDGEIPTKLEFADAAPITPSPAVRAYLRTFGAVALIIYDSGRIGVTRDIARPVSGRVAAIWWCRSAVEAIAVKQQAEGRGE